MSSTITIHKCNYSGEEVFQYPAQILQTTSEKIVVHAIFTSHKDYNIEGLELKKGDKCIEVFYFKKWFNIIEVYAGNSNNLRGWYCNIAKPATIEGDHLYYNDLALDIIRLANGQQTVVDQDEFAQLSLEPQTRKNAQNALDKYYNLYLVRFLFVIANR